MTLRFDGNFTQQEPIPEEAIARAVEVMRSGRLHRYNTPAGEVSETTQFEVEFRDYIGARHCLAVTSGGYALTTALRAAELAQGEVVLTNAFTLSPVPGAIIAAGGRPVLVETTEDLVIDLGDLTQKIAAQRARFLLLSHMRGHIVDMDALLEICRNAGVAVIEDCAHTMGAAWRGTRSGRHGLAACYSTQTYKHLNSGEGGLIISDDAPLMARATVLSGSYMLYGQHLAGPPADAYGRIPLDTPNCSGRMDNLRAALLRPQLVHLDANCVRWNERYHLVAAEIGEVPGIALPARPEAEQYVASSIQFRLPNLSTDAIGYFLSTCQERGVELKWFGAPAAIAYTSNHHSWQYLAPQRLARTDRVLATLFDMRLPLTLSLDDCRTIGTIIRETAQASLKRALGRNIPLRDVS
ncbi:MAG: DegT/DnrJ/EryC1/StrS family aminotransferase [Steroidobacteraceae bacterium]